MMRHRVLAASAAGAMLMLAGCAVEPEGPAASSSEHGSASASTHSSASSTASASSGAASSSSDPASAADDADASVSPEASDAPFPADSSADQAQASADAALVLTAVRSGAHDGFDRIVLELTGPGTPGWTAQYADAAARQGTGEPIDPGGSAVLDITVSGSAIPEEGQATVPAGPISAPSAKVVKGVFNDGTYEGTTHVVIGVDGKHPFRVFAEADPPRVVIDVQH